MPNPIQEEFDQIGLFFGGERPAFRDMMPLLKATSAAAGAGVLRGEHGMPLHRCLFAVVGDFRGRQTRGNKTCSMGTQHSFAFFKGVAAVGGGQMKLRAEWRERQAPKHLVVLRVVGKVNGDGGRHDQSRNNAEDVG